MKILIFGATGMVGQGVLRECLRAPDVEQAIVLGRTPTGLRDPKLREILHADLMDYSAFESRPDSSLSGLDACFFCLGVSSTGMSESAYDRVTFGFTLAAARTLSRLNPRMTFTYVSGAGTDSSEKGSVMWARIKGKTENALLALPLNACMFRPGLIQPLDGIRSKTRSYRLLYALAAPLLPALHRAFPTHILTTREIGQAMLVVARHGSEKRILETADIRSLVQPPAPAQP